MKSQRNARLRALVVGFGFCCAAPTCQDLNPDFVEGAQSTTSGDDDDDDVADTAIPDDTTGTPMSTTTNAAEGTTGEPDPTTSGPAESSGSSDGASTGVEMSTSSGGDESTTGCPGLICGGDGCIDPQTDPDHCGQCGNKCNPAQEQCVDGDCVPN